MSSKLLKEKGTIIEPVIDFSYHSDCTKCPLHRKVTHVGIGGNGSENPDILIIAETPFIYEDRDNITFHPDAPAGRELRDMCEAINEQAGVTFRYTNTVRCSAMTEDKKSRKPTTAEIKNCLPYLLDEIQICNPKVIVLCGATSIKAVLGWSVSIKDIRGKPIFADDGRVYVCMYHPSNMLEYHGNQDSSFRTIKPHEAREMILEDLILAANVALGEVVQEAKIDYTIIDNKLDAFEVLNELRKSGADVADDIEANTYDKTELDTIWKPGFDITCIGLSWEDRKSVVIPFSPNETWNKFRPDEIFKRQWIEAYWKLPNKRIGQNFMYDLLGYWRRFGVDPHVDFDDTLYLHHLRYSHLKHGLAELAKKYTPFGGYDQEMKQAVAKLPVKERGYHKVDFLICAKKNAYDAPITRELRNKFKKEIQEEHPDLLWVYDNIIIPAAHTFMDMTARGIRFNEDWRRTISTDLWLKKHKIQKLLSTLPAWKQAESELERSIKLSKSRDKILMLFVNEGLDPVRVSKKTNMPSVDKGTMEKLAPKSELAFGLQKISEITALEDKIIKPMPDWIGYDGRVHTEYKLHGTRTGRLASARPNTMNFPRGKATGIKEMIEAPDGYNIVYMDVSQAELRIAAHVTEDPYFLKAFNNEQDIHATIAAELFDVPYEKAQKDEEIRRVIKVYNFGLFYGMTPIGLADRTGKSRGESELLYTKYFQRFSNVKKNLFDPTKLELIENGFVSSIYGRIWCLDDGQRREFDRIKASLVGKPKSSIDKFIECFERYPECSKAFREAINFKIQSAASDTVVLGLNGLRRTLNERYEEGIVYLSNEIHDSITLEVKEGYELEVAQIVVECMENPVLPFKLKIPWRVDVKIGHSLAHMIEYDKKERCLKVA